MPLLIKSDDLKPEVFYLKNISVLCVCPAFILLCDSLCLGYLVAEITSKYSLLFSTHFKNIKKIKNDSIIPYNNPQSQYNLHF